MTRLRLDRPDYFRDIQTEAQSYWLGFLQDVSIRGNVVSLHLGWADRAHVAAFREAVGSDHKLCDRWSSRRDGAPTRSCEVSFTCPEMVAGLAALGVSPYRRETATPWRGPEHLLPHYWRGVVDANGWVCASPAALGLCGSLAVVDGFREWVSEFAPNRCRSRPKGKVFVVEYGEAVTAELCRRLYADAAVSLPRKKAKADAVALASAA